MFEVPYYDFSYDDRIFDLPQNRVIKGHVMQIYAFLKENVMDLDFQSISADQYEQIAIIKAILDSQDNEHSRVVYHLISRFRLNPNNSNNNEECGLLHQFCAFGNLNAVKFLFENYPLLDVKAKSHILQSPIQFAVAIAKSPAIAHYLLDNVADILSSEADEGSYTLADALAQRWIESDSSQEYFQTWGSFLEKVLKQDDIRDRLEEEYNNFYLEIVAYEWDQLQVNSPSL